MADLLEQLGSIPPHRVRLFPSPGKAAERDVIRIEAREGRLCELVDGVLVEKPTGFYESRVAAALIYFLEDFLTRHDLGVVVGEAGMMRLAPRRVRIPDVSFISWARLPRRKVPRKPIPDLVPDLAVEVLSASNTPEEMKRKLQEYFQAGVRLVWFIHPGTRKVEVYTSAEEFTLLGPKQTLEGGAVLPGFVLPIQKLFARADRGKGRP
jgi:Uma2 family endonuclease